MLRAKKSRGATDAISVFTEIIDSWDEFQEELQSFDEEQMTRFRTHFNDLFEGDLNVGDELMGEKDDFKMFIESSDDIDNE